ncbi:maleylpyruvate isomerase family mycothiol-dependent enzyme [Streptomyces endophyticus]|uniref:Maleylpyruvate isomerase family mycothiol-dependent enzyme n=1 Tax=Streptomyces endophyticus TaxID=714166 RepID=A0ABU6F4R7_9ACTN|nr:maleylpyruvate isomerase family mycothiol-dependent enzyme [Streptomyces endophyticus]MEB8338994.1 maleylpyruvate isomerase family mycothiol-dependent enzyme [Streptomyces endophyticus]
MATDARDHATVSELLGAWALQALPADEQRAVPAHLADCEECAAEAERLRATVRTLNGPNGNGANGDGSNGHGAADVPQDDAAGHPFRTGTGPLAAALAHRPPVPRAAPAAAPHAQPYAATVAALQALLAEADDAWSTEVVHGWTVRDTVAHLIAADEPLAVHLGLPAHEPPAHEPPADAPDDGGDWRTAWEARTRTVIAHERARDPHATVAVWRDRAAELLAAPAATDPELAAQAATLMGARLPVAEHFLVRAFETWIHSHDIGRALDRPVPPPPAGHLWRLVRLAVRILGQALGPKAPPVALTVTDASRTTEWVLGSEDEPVRAEIALDPVDFCLLIGGRTAPDTLPPGTGDPTAARTLLNRAAQLAWL